MEPCGRRNRLMYLDDREDFQISIRRSFRVYTKPGLADCSRKET